ncbi:leucine-rich repeat protein [Butyrivibrio sp. AD3002]|uniref:leucine-rich repeat protein n=1 Tax=Butyrivibrio sp. AD3002 TaxID=1280670 RepID=UPI0003B41B12|nr:leucine-rich repeat protein [Butyrivibrio sp. AD3002]
MRGCKLSTKRFLSFVLIAYLCFVLQPISALANDTKDTFSNIPIMLQSGTEAVEKGKATLKFNSSVYSVRDEGEEYQIVSAIGSKPEDLGPGGQEVTIDSGYDLAQVYSIFISGVTSDSLQPNSVSACVLTVPVPDGCTATGAKRVVKWGKNAAAGNPDTQREDAIDNKDGTVSINIVVGIGRFTDTSVQMEGLAAIEFKKLEETKDIATLKGTASLTPVNAEYTGAAITPEVTITGLTKDVDFTVAYTNNIEPGTATVTITGKGAFTGSFTLEFTINKKEYKQEEVNDEKTGASYEVTTNADGTINAIYKTPTDKKAKKIKIPENVTLPDGSTAKVTQIAPKAFKDSKATQITIPKTVTKISAKAFEGSSAKKIILKTDKKAQVSIGKGAFKKMKAKKTTIQIKGCKGNAKKKLSKQVKKQASSGTTVK